jgi:hypothetical protein
VSWGGLFKRRAWVLRRFEETTINGGDYVTSVTGDETRGKQLPFLRRLRPWPDSSASWP